MKAIGMTQLPITVRNYRPADLPAMARLLRETIRLVNRGASTQAQVEPWRRPCRSRALATKARAGGSGRARRGASWVFCAWERSGFVKFPRGASCSANGRASGSGSTMPASVTAQPFFVRHGIRIVKHQPVHGRGVDLPNAVRENSVAAVLRAEKRRPKYRDASGEGPAGRQSRTD